MTLVVSSGGVGLPVGALMAAHGVNNIYEGVSGVYGFFTNEDAATGVLKEWVYRGAVRAVGLDPAWGDVIYSGADIGLSLGAMGLKIHSAPRLFSSEKVFGQKAWKLERLIETDFQRG